MDPREPGATEAYARCYEEFSAGGDPRIDVHRLSMLCGPSTGMMPLSGVLDVRVDEDTEARHVLRSEGGGICYRFFAAAEGTIEDLEIEVAGSDGARRSLGSQGERWAVAPADGPFCPPRAEDTTVVIRSHGGAGRVALARWYRP